VVRPVKTWTDDITGSVAGPVFKTMPMCTWVSMSGTTTPWCTLLETGKVSSNKTGTETLHDHTSDFIESGRDAPPPGKLQTLACTRPYPWIVKPPSYRRASPGGRESATNGSQGLAPWVTPDLILYTSSSLSFMVLQIVHRKPGFKPTRVLPRLIVMDHNVFTLYTELDQIIFSWF
jgi:hypothetical protein